MPTSKHALHGTTRSRRPRDTRRGTAAACSLSLALLAAAIPGATVSVAQSGHPGGDKPAPGRPAPSPLPNFDARAGREGRGSGDRSPRAQDAVLKGRFTALAAFRAQLPQAARDGLVVELKNNGAPKALFSYDGPLTGARRGTPDAIARGFLREHQAIHGLDAREIDGLALTREDPDGGTTFLQYAQTIDGLAVHGSDTKIAISSRGEVISLGAGDIAPGLRVDTTPRMAEEEAIARAFEYAGADRPVVVTTALQVRSNRGGRAVYANPLGPGRMKVVSDLQVLPTDDGGRLVWREHVDAGGPNYYQILVDANTGELLGRTSLVAEAAQGTVYTANPLGTPTRRIESFRRDGTASPFGWLGLSTTSSGNNVDAYLDTDGDDVPDEFSNSGDEISSGRAYAPSQNFTFPFSPDTDPRSQQGASATNLFYFCNVAHDYFYNLGFNESAGNFQTYNFGRGGEEGDAVFAETQDGSGMNNANFFTAPEGESPRMQMFLFDYDGAPDNDFDSSLDGDVVLHEYAHGVSSRTIGGSTNSGGLGGTQSSALGEGWSDYFAVSYFGDGVVAEYSSNNATVGLRRTSYATYSPNNDSYADLGNTGWEPHDDGEIWCKTLWELRQVLGPTVCDRLVYQGMKFTPSLPSFLNARDGIILCDRELYNGAHVNSIWSVFAAHGMGTGATGNDGFIHNANTSVGANSTNYVGMVMPGMTFGASLQTNDTPTSTRPGCYTDKSWFAGTAGVPVTIKMNSTAFDTYLNLKGPSGNLVAFDDDSGEGVNSLLTYTPTVSGNFTIEATSYQSYRTGTYTLSFTMYDPHFMQCGASRNDNLAAADLVSPNRPSGCYAEYYTFQGYPGMTVTIQMWNVNGLDPFIYLKNPAGQVIGADDDGNGYPNSRLTMTLGDNGLYTVEATTYAPQQIGNFVISITCS